MAYHDNLLRSAKRAISALFADTSVNKSTTLASLQDLADEIELLIDCIERDLAHEEGGQDNAGT